MNIIIIDDEPKIRKGMSNLFGGHPGWQTEAFASAESALAYLYTHEVDVIVTDIQMPGMLGLDMLEKLREVNREVPVIILSGYSRFEYARRAIDLGVRKYLTKPTSAEEIQQVLEQIEAELSARRDSIQTRVAHTLDKPVSNLLILRALEHIDNHYQKKLSLKDVASALYISPNYLSELFKKTTGSTFSEYLQDVRMEKSKCFLEDISYRIGDVSKLVGFSDSRYFSSTFRRKYHMTPMEYRSRVAQREGRELP